MTIVTAASETKAFDPEQFRPDFPILARTVHDGVPLVYFDNAATSQRPRQVIQTIVEAYERHYANVHRGIHTLSEEIDELYENAREKVRAFINAPSEPPEGDSPATTKQVIFTSGTTHSINLVARSWGDANVCAGDEILLTEMEHHSNLVPWYQLAERTGAVVRHIPLTDDGRLDLDKLDTLLTKRTKLVSVTAVSNVLGTINPIAEIIRRAHDAGALVLVDGAQSVPHMKIDVQAADVDFLAFSGHKMLGPSGVGVLYGKLALLEAMPPFLGGGGMIEEVTLQGFRPLYLPGKFEAGTPPIVPAVALGAAIDYLNAVGLEAVGEHERRLTRRAHEVLESLGGIRILRPAPCPRRGPSARSRWRGHPRRAPLHHAAPQAFRRGCHGSGELLLLQHAGRGRQAGRALRAGEAPLPAKITPPPWRPIRRLCFQRPPADICGRYFSGRCRTASRQSWQQTYSG
jgi:cysteine desulfurase/selenocysteine lyase